MYIIFWLLMPGWRTAGFSGEHFQNMLQKFNPENGRMEQFRIKGTGVMLNLAKNPAGFNQNISAVMQIKHRKILLSPLTTMHRMEQIFPGSGMWILTFWAMQAFIPLQSAVSAARICASG